MLIRETAAQGTGEINGNVLNCWVARLLFESLSACRHWFIRLIFRTITFDI